MCEFGKWPEVYQEAAGEGDWLGRWAEFEEEMSVAIGSWMCACASARTSICSTVSSLGCIIPRRLDR